MTVSTTNWDLLMDEAIGRALLGRGQVEPNPCVGALMLQDGEVVGRGYHQYYGGPHAEVLALNDARELGARPDTAIVTMEPCSAPIGADGKKTGPCVQALIDAKIRRVVVGAIDADERHRRRGLVELERHGIEVIEGVQADACRAANRAFEKWLQLDRPWTIAKWAMTLDGKTASSVGQARWISGVESRRRTHELRAHCDAVIVGYRTARMDNPELTVRHVEGPQPLRLVVDPLAEIAEDSKLVRTAGETPVWVLARQDVQAERVDRLQELGVEVVRLPGGEGSRDLQLDETWRELRRRGMRRVLVEGGGSLVAGLMRNRCIDQVQAFLAPKIIGGRESPTAVMGDGCSSMQEAWGVSDWTWQSSGDDLLLIGFVDEPSESDEQDLSADSAR